MKHDNNLNPTMLYAFRKAMGKPTADEALAHTVREIIGKNVR